MKALFTLSILALISLAVTGQNLEELGVKKGLKMTGSLTLNTVGYAASGIQARRDPINFFVSGNFNLNLFG